jgi:hypothetical protein
MEDNIEYENKRGEGIYGSLWYRMARRDPKSNKGCAGSHRSSLSRDNSVSAFNQTMSVSCTLMSTDKGTPPALELPWLLQLGVLYHDAVHEAIHLGFVYSFYALSPNQRSRRR